MISNVLLSSVILAYYIECHPNRFFLSSKIVEHISNGWEPQGGLSYHAGNYCQAMIRKEKKGKKDEDS